MFLDKKKVEDWTDEDINEYAEQSAAMTGYLMNKLAGFFDVTDVTELESHETAIAIILNSLLMVLTSFVVIKVGNSRAGFADWLEVQRQIVSMTYETIINKKG